MAHGQQTHIICNCASVSFMCESPHVSLLLLLGHDAAAVLPSGWFFGLDGYFGSSLRDIAAARKAFPPSGQFRLHRLVAHSYADDDACVLSACV